MHTSSIDLTKRMSDGISNVAIVTMKRVENAKQFGFPCGKNAERIEGERHMRTGSTIYLRTHKAPPHEGLLVAYQYLNA